VKHHYIDGARYQKSRNLREAQAVAAAACNHLVERSDESLGVAAFNSQQRDLILNEIEVLQKKDAELDRILRAQEEAEESFFVKNLENVQGDEREVIFISTTYGPDHDTGKVYQRFGPIAGSTGWRRLNVIFTRARKRLELFTSLRSSDIIAGDQRSEGVTALRNYLTFAETGYIPDQGRSSGEPESPFEMDVAETLRTHGFTVSAQIGVAGFFIDIGVHDPRETGSYVLGIECDGATYHSTKSARERDRLRQEILELKGWKLHRIWSTDWFNNRATEIERMVLAAETAVRESRGEFRADNASIRPPVDPTGEDRDLPTAAALTGTTLDPNIGVRNAGFQEPSDKLDVDDRTEDLPDIIPQELWLKVAKWAVAGEHFTLAERGMFYLIADGTFSTAREIQPGRELLSQAIRLGFRAED
jgi:very-short-patch-repair endonuclease